MEKPANFDERLAKLADVALRPIAASIERRNVSARDALRSRIRHEFDEMPGTSLTLAQATRLFGVPGEICGRILVELIGDGRLRQTPDRRFRRGAA